MKKILIFIMLLAPMSMLAQKFGYVNSSELIQLMPEFAKAQQKMEDLEKTYTAEFNAMRTELEKKGTEFEKLQQDSVPESILKRRYEELLQMEQRLQQFGQEVQQKLAMAEQEEMLAIQTKLREALEAVGRDGGYVCIYDLSGGMPYVSKTLCEDVTMKIRTKLGIPANAVVK
ncbi:MAG: OmpH family outer membrane protein [Bacteroidaceae bacterium]|nr:OmpH family outer membrane protein [Bacteroidaceae bacterium]